MADYMMQARSSTTGLMVAWLSPGSPDWDGSEYPGAGMPEYIAATIVGQAAGGGSAAGGAGDAQWGDGSGGFTEDPGTGRVQVQTVLADHDDYVKPRSGVGHVTTTDAVDTSVAIGPSLADQSSARIDVVVTAAASIGGVFANATFTIRAVITNDGGMRFDDGGEDPSPYIHADLAGVDAYLDWSGTAPTVNFVGLAATRITWGWEARVQVQTLEPESP